MNIKSFFGSEKSKNIYFDKIENPHTSVAFIFLHGLAGSRRQWDRVLFDLSHKASLYFADLLGFGYSAKPHTTYTLDVHVKALRLFIKNEVKEKHIILVGHSLGAIVALGYLAKYPKGVEKIVLFSLPFYLSSDEAMTTIQAYSKPKYFVIDSIFTKVACTLWCYYGGSISKHIMPHLYKNLPKIVARDALLHTYNSYITSLYEVIYHQNLEPLIADEITKKILLVHGELDEVAPLKNIQRLSKKYNIKLDVFVGEGHGVPHEARKRTYDLLNSLL